MESVHVKQIVLTSTCCGDVSLKESSLTCCVMCTLIFSDKLVIECHLYNRLPPFRLCPIMKVIVGQIVLVRTPFEVIHMVVCLVFILMVNHWQIVLVTDEGFSDKSMNEKRLRLIVSP